MKHGIMQRVTGAALVAVLVFNWVVPVPILGQDIERHRLEQAHANPAVAAAVVCATALAAYGVYVAGSTVEDYASNRNQVYSDFISANGLTQEAADSMMQSAVTSDGNVDLGMLANAGFFGLVPALISGLSQGGYASVSENSKARAIGCTIELNGKTLNAFTSLPSEFTLVNAKRPEIQQSAGYTGYDKLLMYYEQTSYGKKQYWFYFTNGNECNFRSGTGWETSRYYPYYFITEGSSSIGYGSNTIYRVESTGIYLWNPEIEYTYGSNVSVSNEVYGNERLTYEASVMSGEMAVPDNVVQVFEPTTEQLSAGYDSTAVLEAEIANQSTVISQLQDDVIEQGARIGALESSVTASNARVGTLESEVSSLSADVDALNGGIEGVGDTLGDILDTIAPWTTTIGSILAALNPLALILQGVNSIVNFVTSIASVVTGIEVGPFDWLQSWWLSISSWWSTLLQWLAVNDAASWWGTLSGWWEGLLDWVGDTPVGDLVGELQGVLEGVQSGVLAIPGEIAAAAEMVTAAVDGLLAGEISVKPGDFGTGSGEMSLSADVRSRFDALLDEKAPFCYVRKMQRVEQGIAATFSSSPSFYVDVPIPQMEEGLRFDAGMVLNQSWNGNTVAGYMRLCMTALLCAGMIALAIRISMSVLGIGGGGRD